MKRDLAEVGGEWKMRDGGVETVGVDDSETGLVTKKRINKLVITA